MSRFFLNLERIEEYGIMNKKVVLYILTNFILISIRCTNVKKLSKDDITTKDEMNEETRTSEL